jgi:hypothetical protein
VTFAEGVPGDASAASIDTGIPDPEPTDATDPPIPPGRFACGVAPCMEHFETAAKAGVHRWNAHQVRGKKSTKAREAAGGASGDRVPPSVTFNLGGPGGGGKDATLDDVEKRARDLLTTISAFFLIAGLRDDAADLQKGSEPWAKAVRDLAEYEEWLRKMAAGGETSGRITAWINLLLVTVGLAAPVLVRHGMLPEGMAEKAREAFGIAQTEGDPSAQTV